MRRIFIPTALFFLVASPRGIQGEGDEHNGIVCLDSGHPSYPGDKPCESMINRKVAFLLSDCLEQNGFKVVLTVEDVEREALFSPGFDCEDEGDRAKLQAVSPEDRAKSCNEQHSDFAISIHHNYSYDRTVNHSLVLYGEDARYTPLFEEAPEWAEITAADLAKAMAVTQSVAASDQDVLGGSLAILRSMEMIGILTEASFYSNPKERKRLEDPDYLEAEAQAICEAFLKFAKADHH